MENSHLQKMLEEFFTPIFERSLAEVMQKQLRASDAHENYQNDILSANEAAQFIGVSLATLYGLTSARKIPHNKRGKRLYFDRQELISWVREGKRKTQAEIENEAASYISTTRYGKHSQPAQIKKH
jgi:excisionase family DNA binding protein